MAALNRVFGRITPDRSEQRNILWQMLGHVGYYGAYFLCQSELLWTYLAQCGFSNTQLGSITMYLWFASALGMFVFMGWADRFKRRLLAAANTGAFLLVQPLGIIVLLLIYPTQQPHVGLLYGVIILSVSNALIYAFHWMLEMTIFVRTIRDNTRGKVWGAMAVATAIANILVLAQLARWAQRVLAPNIALIFFMAMAAGLLLLRALSFVGQRELPDLAVEGAKTSANPFVTMWEVLRVKACRAIIYPQILRGATGAIALFIIPFAVKHLETPPTFGAHMGLMGQIGLITGGLLVALMRDRLGSGLVILIGDTLVGIGFGLLLLDHHWMAVLPIYALVTIGNTIEANAVPLACFTVIPAHIMGAFSGVRMTILSIAWGISSHFGGQLLDVVNPVLVFGIVAILKVVNAIWFWWVFRVYRPVNPAPAAGPVAH